MDGECDARPPLLRQIGFGANLVHVMHGTGGVIEEQAPAITNLLAALFFPIPLLMILMTGQELITANLSESTRELSKLISQVSVSMAAINGRIKYWEVPVNWVIVFFGNLTGVLVYAILLGESTNRRRN